MKNLYTALDAARAQFGRAAKDGFNPHLKNKFATLAAMIEATDEALRANRLTVGQKSGMFDGVLALRTTLVHLESGESEHCDVPLATSDDPKTNKMQALGSAISYARRFGYETILGLLRDDDDGEGSHPRRDGNHGHDRYNGPQRPQERPQSPPQRPAGPRAEQAQEPPRAAPPKPWKAWVIAASQVLDIHPTRFVNHMGKALAEHLGAPVPVPAGRDAFLAHHYAASADVREFLAAECRRYRAKLAAEPAADEADPDPDDDAIGSRE